MDHVRGHSMSYEIFAATRCGVQSFSIFVIVILHDSALMLHCSLRKDFLFFMGNILGCGWCSYAKHKQLIAQNDVT